MYRLSLIIDEIYNKYLPLASKAGITLNLDFPNPTVKIDNPDRVKKHLDEHLDQAVKRSKSAIKGEISITVHQKQIILRDTGTVLSKSACKLLSGEHVSVKSRVGFGTSVTIDF